MNDHLYGVSIKKVCDSQIVSDRCPWVINVNVELLLSRARAFIDVKKTYLNFHA